jgi:hypothetical protein
MKLGQAVRWCVEQCWGCCNAPQPSGLDTALAQIRDDSSDDDIELRATDRVDDLYTRLLPNSNEANPADPLALVPVPLNSPPKLTFSNMLMHESVIAERLKLKKTGWAVGTLDSLDD